VVPGSVDAVIVAAGSSARMAGVDKLRATMLGRPVLAWTVDAIASASCVRRVVLVTAPSDVAALAREDWVRDSGAQVVAGGARRQESVAAGVAATDAPVVLVHDGARPLVTPGLVDAVASAAVATGAAIPIMPVAETLKRSAGGLVGETVDRSGLAAAQTPQAARRALLERAWSLFPPTGPREFTDEAALLEAAGIPVASVPGDAANLKVTVPEDLPRAAAILAARLAAARPALARPARNPGRATAGSDPRVRPAPHDRGRATAGSDQSVRDLETRGRAGSGSVDGAAVVPPRVGHGADEHPFGEETGLALGGIVIEGAPRLRGHSDGDVALHALADALLGAAGLGDLGRVFPAGDPATRGLPSGEMLGAVVRQLADAGWRPSSADVTIRAGRPRFGGARLDAMRGAIALLLGLPEQAVQVKASSGNLVGFEGAGRGIAATAVATILRR